MNWIYWVLGILGIDLFVCSYQHGITVTIFIVVIFTMIIFIFVNSLKKGLVNLIFRKPCFVSIIYPVDYFVISLFV